MLLIRRLVVAVMISLAMLAGASPRALATVNSSVNKTIALGTGAATQFSFSFVGVSSAYISVIFTDSAGNETLLSQGSGTSQYTIVLNAPVQGAIWGTGGTVTYNPSGVPIPVGSTLTIFRVLPLTQAISLANQSSIQTLGKGAETGLDTSVMQSQQISENISRAIVAPVSDPTPPAPLPPIAQRANQGAAFDGSGNLVAGALPSSGVISSAMQPVVNAATLALARTAFGLGSVALENIGAGLEDDGSGNLRVNSSFVSVATNQVVDGTFAQKAYIATGPINFTLNRSNTLWNGFGFTIYVASGSIVVTPNANDNFVGLASGSSLTIPAGSMVRISTDGANSGLWIADPTAATATTGSLTVLSALAATKAVQQAGTSAGLVVTPSQQQSHDSATKVWVSFNSTGVITASYNVQTVTHPATGSYTVIFNLPFASASYQCSVTTEGSSGAGVIGTIGSGGRLADRVTVSILNSSFTGADPGFGHVACHGRQ